MESDPALIRRCLAADRVAWSELLARYGDLVYGTLHRAGLDAETSADAFQEVSILLWKSLGALRKTDRLAPWLVVTAKRVAWRMRVRAKARRGREEARARPEAAPGAPPPSELAAIEEEQAVRAALAGMGERCRRLLTALYFEAAGGGYDEVSLRLGIPRGSIGPTRQRCLEALRASLSALGVRSDVSDAPAAVSAPTSRPSRPRRRGRP